MLFLFSVLECSGVCSVVYVCVMFIMLSGLSGFMLCFGFLIMCLVSKGMLSVFGFMIPECCVTFCVHVLICFCGLCVL